MGQKVSYILSLVLAVVFVNVLAYIKDKENHQLVRALRQLIFMIGITILTSLFAIVFPNKRVSLLLQSIHYVCTEWVLIVLMHFLTIENTKLRLYRITKQIIYTYAILCSSSLLLNDLFHHVVTNRLVEVDGAYVYEFLTVGRAYAFHLYFSYGLVGAIVVILLVGYVKSAKLYRKKYLYPFLVFALTVGLDGICKVMKYPYDYALYGYALLGIFFTYFHLFYKPQSLITKTLVYSVAESHNGVICFDPNNQYIYANDVARQLNDEITSEKDFEEKFKKLLRTENFEDEKDRKWIQEVPAEDGNVLYYEVSFAKLYDEKSNYIGCCFTICDKTEDVEQYKQERYRATHDSITCLHNRDYFYERVLEIKQENPEDTYYMVCMDIKDFKLVNELFGYQKGSQILIDFAEFLKNTVPENVLCARIVSDHFAMWISQKDFQEKLLLDCIKKAQGLIHSTEFQLHVQAGIYEIRPEDNDVSVMCDRANMAIQTVKHDYECSIVYYDKKLMNQVMNAKKMINEFENALQNHQFIMYLQPQVAIDGSVLGAEALVRWIHPEKGKIPPGEFIHVFEDAGLIYRLDQCVWEQAACKLREWEDMGQDQYYISVNISAKDFYYIDIYKSFTELVEKYGISPEKLKLEITESALMQDLDKQLELLGRLQKYGFQVEIDDFGSGYSSLNMLKNIKAEVLKIDMGFLQEIKDHERTKVILSMVVNLAKQLNMIVVTEGVENKDQVEYLTKVGCDIFQGFYFAKPISVLEFEQLYFKQLENVPSE